MTAKVTKQFKGRRDHEAVTRVFAVGDVVSGELAAVAVKQGWAEEIEASADVESDGGDEVAQLKAMTVKELRALAKAEGTSLTDLRKEDDIIAAIIAARKAA